MHEPPAIYGIIGNPLDHSLSPQMHNAAFKALKVNAVYKLFPLADEEELKLFFEDLKEKDNPIFGLNVTIPYKEKVLPFMDIVDPFAAKVGAVNTIVITHSRKILGFNTDGPGFLSHLNELRFDPAGKRISILGAGGTARAIISVLCMIPNRPQKILLYNRTRANAIGLIEAIAPQIDTSIVQVADEPEDLNIELADLLINTTSIGMQANDPMLFDAALVHKNMLVYDVIYDPAQTKLLSAAKARGSRIANGLGMLFFQGALAFQHWAELPLEGPVKKIMRDALKKKEQT